MSRITIADLNHWDRDAFVAALGAIYEHSPWVASAAFDQRPFTDAAALASAMRQVVEDSGAERKLALLRAHPDLAGRAAIAGDLAEASRREQAGAGLDRLTREQFAHFERINAAYRARHGFPFIIAVKGLTAVDILAAYERRCEADRDTEFREALDQVHRIAAFRLADRLGP